MAENNNKKLDTYEYYFNVLQILLADMSNITLNDIQDVVDELNVELSNIEKEGIEVKESDKNEMPTYNGENSQ